MTQIDTFLKNFNSFDIARQNARVFWEKRTQEMRTKKSRTKCSKVMNTEADQ